MRTLLQLRNPRLLNIRGTEEKFPVGRVFCVGKNYAEHIREMGGDPLLTSPTFFMKTAQSVFTGKEAPISKMPPPVHYEGELVLAVCKAGYNLPVENALGCVFGTAAGIDLTLRDIQADLKKQGKPWEVSKAFDHSAPVGEITPGFDWNKLAKAELKLSLNGEVKQRSVLDAMIWKPAEIIFHLSKTFELLPGDLIFTGTPAGIGPISPGDRISLSIGNLEPLEISAC